MLNKNVNSAGNGCFPKIGPGKGDSGNNFSCKDLRSLGKGKGNGQVVENYQDGGEGARGGYFKKYQKKVESSGRPSRSPVVNGRPKAQRDFANGKPNMEPPKNLRGALEGKNASIQQQKNSVQNLRGTSKASGQKSSRTGLNPTPSEAQDQFQEFFQKNFGSIVDDQDSYQQQSNQQ